MPECASGNRLRGEGLPGKLLDEKAMALPFHRGFGEALGPQRHAHRPEFFLHLSKGRAAQALHRRIDQPQKNWKFSLADIERKFWKDTCRPTRNAQGDQHEARALLLVPAAFPAQRPPHCGQYLASCSASWPRSLELSYPKTSARTARLMSLRTAWPTNRPDNRHARHSRSARGGTRPARRLTPCARRPPTAPRRQQHGRAAQGGIACSCDTFASTSPILNTALIARI